MKKAKALLAFLTAVTMTVGALSVTAYAEKTTAAATETEARTQEGTFKDGACYCFVKSSGTLIIDGEGSFTAKEYNTLVKKLSPRIVFFDKDVVLPKNDKNIYRWLASILAFSNDYTVFSVENSNIVEKRREMLNKLKVQLSKDRKDLGWGEDTLSDMFPLECINDHIKYPRSFFDFCDGAVDKGKKTVEYLMEKGITERTAKKVTAIYLIGLQCRIDWFCAFPDGREMNEETEKDYMNDLLITAEDEEVLLPQLNEDGLTFDNAASYISEKGLFLTKRRNHQRLGTLANRYDSQFYSFHITGKRPQELIDAEEEHDRLYEDQFLPPEDADLETILKYRADWIRDKIYDPYKYPKELVDEVVGYYIEGLKIRLSEGLAMKNGLELNGETSTDFIHLCDDYLHDSLRLEEIKKDDEISDEVRSSWNKSYEEDLRKTLKLLVSDYTVDTEDSKTKYVNSNGDYVKYYDVTGNKGTLPDGVEYQYCPATRGIYLDGDAAITQDDFTNLTHFFDIGYYIMGKKIDYDKAFLIKNTYDTEPKELTYNTWVFRHMYRRYETLFTFEDSLTKKYYDEVVDAFFYHQDKHYYSRWTYPLKERNIIEEQFKIGIIKDDDELFKLLNGTEKAVPDGVKATLRGDADEDGQLGLSDIIAVAKFTSNSRAYPLATDTAKANADMNGDSMIDSLDVSILIEEQIHQNKNKAE